MRYRIIGADKETGEDVDLTIDAADLSGAETYAQRKQILVSSVEPVSSPRKNAFNHDDSDLYAVKVAPAPLAPLAPIPIKPPIPPRLQTSALPVSRANENQDREVWAVCEKCGHVSLRKPEERLASFGKKMQSSRCPKCNANAVSHKTINQNTVTPTEATRIYASLIAVVRAIPIWLRVVAVLAIFGYIARFFASSPQPANQFDTDSGTPTPNTATVRSDPPLPANVVPKQPKTIQRTKQDQKSDETKRVADAKAEARADAEQRKILFPTRDVNSWKGLKIVVLMNPRDGDFHLGGLLQGQLDEVRFKAIAGRVGTVTEAELELFAGHIGFLLDGETTAIYATTGSSRGSIQQVCLLDDLTKAQLRYKGKNLWSQRVIVELAALDHLQKDFVCLKFAPLQVVDVVAGTETARPIRFIVKNGSGERGFVDVAMSHSNDAWNHEGTSFDDCLVLYDPLDGLVLSAAVKSAIQSEEVVIGMTVDQLKMSIGKPEAVNSTKTAFGSHDQWIYEKPKKRYVYVENEIVTGVQEQGQ